MPSKKLPYMPFYIGDWRKDPGVRALDLEARMVWFEMMCDMWECKDRGKLLINGVIPDDKKLANFYGISQKKLKRIKKEIIFYGVASEDEKTGGLFNRRMVNDEKLRAIRSECGKKGGNPALKKEDLVEDLLNQEVKQTLIYDIDNETEVKGFKKTNEPIRNSDSGAKPVKKQKSDSGAGPASKPEARDPVEDFLIFAQKTHEQERKAFLMIRGIVDREKIKSLFDGGIDQKTLGFAWLEFLEDEGDYFQQSDAPPHNIAVFHGQVETGHYLEAAARRFARTKAKSKPQAPPKAREPVDPQLTGLWDRCLGKIKDQISSENFATWFEPTYARSLENGSLTVAVPNQFSRKCLIENYRDLIEKTLHGIRDGPLLVDFCIEADRVQLDTG